MMPQIDLQTTEQKSSYQLYDKKTQKTWQFNLTSKTMPNTFFWENVTMKQRLFENRLIIRATRFGIGEKTGRRPHSHPEL